MAAVLWYHIGYYKCREPICSTVNHLRLSSNPKKCQSHDPALELYEKISGVTLVDGELEVLRK